VPVPASGHPSPKAAPEKTPETVKPHALGMLAVTVRIAGAHPADAVRGRPADGHAGIRLGYRYRSKRCRGEQGAR
jgi:hypothetical protein